MGNVIVYLDIPSYLRNWMIHKFGSPIRLPKHSVESREISYLLTQQPVHMPIDIGSVSSTRFEVCYVTKRRLYLTKEAKTIIVNRIILLFDADFWHHMLHIDYQHLKISHRIESYMERNQISLDSFETLLKKYTRLRDHYDKHHIKLK